MSGTRQGGAATRERARPVRPGRVAGWQGWRARFSGSRLSGIWALVEFDWGRAPRRCGTAPTRAGDRPVGAKLDLKVRAARRGGPGRGSDSPDQHLAASACRRPGPGRRCTCARLRTSLVHSVGVVGPLASGAAHRPYTYCTPDRIRTCDLTSDSSAPASSRGRAGPGSRTGARTGPSSRARPPGSKRNRLSTRV
jgi:hypothetical protein